VWWKLRVRGHRPKSAALDLYRVVYS